LPGGVQDPGRRQVTEQAGRVLDRQAAAPHGREPYQRDGLRLKRQQAPAHVNRSAQCASSIAITTGARPAASSSIPLIRSTSHNCWSYSDASPAKADPSTSGRGPDRKASRSGAPGAIWSISSA
jgi:hypothetical protein